MGARDQCVVLTSVHAVLENCRVDVCVWRRTRTSDAMPGLGREMADPREWQAAAIELALGLHDH